MGPGGGEGTLRRQTPAAERSRLVVWLGPSAFVCAHAWTQIFAGARLGASAALGPSREVVGGGAAVQGRRRGGR